MKSRLKIYLGICMGILSGCDAMMQQIPLPGPEAAFEILDGELVAPCEVHVFNKSYFGTRFEWDAGNGRIYADRDPIIYYVDEGSYNLRLTVYDEDGNSDSYEHQVEITGDPSLPEPSPWAGSWRVVDQVASNVSTASVAADPAPINARTHANMPDLSWYQIEGWDSPILTRSGNFDPDNIEGGLIRENQLAYMAFGYYNGGDIATERFFAIRVFLDGNFWYEFNFNGIINPGATFYNYDLGLDRLSAGSHTVAFELDPYDVITEEDETNNSYEVQFEVLPNTTFDSFEFNENRYFIRYAQNQTRYGSLHHADGTLHLDQIGPAEIISIEIDQMSLRIDDHVYELARMDNLVVDATETRRLIHHGWVHQESNMEVQRKDEWMFTGQGALIHKFSGGHQVLSWEFVEPDIMNISYGDNRAFIVVELTNTRLNTVDIEQNSYLLYPESTQN